MSAYPVNTQNVQVLGGILMSAQSDILRVSANRMAFLEAYDFPDEDCFIGLYKVQAVDTLSVMSPLLADRISIMFRPVMTYDRKYRTGLFSAQCGSRADGIILDAGDYILKCDTNNGLLNIPAVFCRLVPNHLSRQPDDIRLGDYCFQPNPNPKPPQPECCCCPCGGMQWLI